MAEFTLVLPVLAILLFGIIQFGITFNNYITLTDAVRAGALLSPLALRPCPAEGGFGIAAHPDSPKAALRWQGWDTTFDAE